MLYNPKNILDRHNARLYLENLLKGDVPFEIRKKVARRTLKQNAYLHLLLSYFAAETGNTLDYVKMQYFKLTVNREMFVREKYDSLLNRNVRYIASTSELSTEEMTTAIERFRNWSSAEPGIYLPEATSQDEIIAMQIEIEKFKKYL